MKPIVVFDSKGESFLEIKKRMCILQKKYGLDLNQLQEKVASNQELDTDEVIDNLMLWRALNLSCEEKNTMVSIQM